MDQASVLHDVLLERGHQESKWGVQRHTLSYWMLILNEEVGECSKALLEHDLVNYREELVQVAAVAVAAIESFDAGSRKM